MRSKAYQGISRVFVAQMVDRKRWILLINLTLGDTRAEYLRSTGARLAVRATKIVLEKKDRSASSARSQPSAPADCIVL